jgi:dUTP pyrophosphatase
MEMFDGFIPDFTTAASAMNGKEVISFLPTPGNESAMLPSKQHDSDVGFDLYTDQMTVLHPGKVTKVSTGLKYAGVHPKDPMKMQSSRFFTKIEGRSGLAAKGIFPVGGIIDPDYRGEVMVLLFNSTDEYYILEAGDRCAQLVPYSLVDASVEFAEFIVPTKRDVNGFGSSGK